MSVREMAFACILAVAFTGISAGAALTFAPAGLIVGGVLLAVFGWILLGGDE